MTAGVAEARDDALEVRGTPLVAQRARRLPRGLPVVAGMSAIILGFIIVGAFAPLLAPHDPGTQDLANRLRPPLGWGGSWRHPLGTDNLGRDVLSRMIYGARVSLVVVATAIPVSTAVGTTAGLLAGWHRRLLDRALMRLVDIQLALPVVLFAILIAATFGGGLWTVVLVIAGWNWAGYARLVRSQVLSLREQDFVTAAQALGATNLWIMSRHLLPNVLNTVVIIATLNVAAVILAEAALSFLGVGVPVTTPSWGNMVSEGRDFITVAWWLVTMPGLAILLVSLAGNFLGDWLRDALDPHLRNVR